MFQLNTFHFYFWLFSKEKIILFTKHMRIQSRSYNKNKRSFSTNPFAPSFFENQKDFFKFESDWFFDQKYYVKPSAFFLFLYPYSIGTAFESIENLFFCMNRYYYIPIPSRYLPRKIPNWIQNWRVGVSLSMQLCTLQIGINFLKDPGFRALVSRPRSFRWPMLCWRDIYMIRSIA